MRRPRLLVIYGLGEMLGGTGDKNETSKELFLKVNRDEEQTVIPNRLLFILFLQTDQSSFKSQFCFL